MPHRLLPHEAEEPADAHAGGELSTEVEVRDDVEIRREREILVDRLDSVRPGVQRAAEVDRLALHAQVAVVRRVRAGEDLHQCRLAGAVVADDRGDGPPREGDRDLIECHHAAEALAHADRLEHGRLLSPARFSGGVVD